MGVATSVTAKIISVLTFKGTLSAGGGCTQARWPPPSFASVRLGRGDGVEYADEFELARQDGVGDALDDQGVLVVKDLSSCAALNQVVVVG